MKFSIYTTTDWIRNISYLFTKSITQTPSSLLHTHVDAGTENANRRIGKLINFDTVNWKHVYYISIASMM